MDPMASRKKLIRTAALWSTLACSTGVLIGCRTGCPTPGHGGDLFHDPCADVVKGSMPQPLGTFAREFMYRQSAKAEADDFVIYLYEWSFEDPAQLGPFGRRHLVTIAKRMPEAPFNVLIESSADPRLDETRQANLVNLLAQAGGVHDPAGRVRVGFPSAEGLYGDEAEAIYSNLINGGAGVGIFGNDFNNGNGGGGFGNGGFGNGGSFGGNGLNGQVPTFR